MVIFIPNYDYYICHEFPITDKKALTLEKVVTENIHSQQTAVYCLIDIYMFYR